MPTTKPRIYVTLDPPWLAELWQITGTSQSDKCRRAVHTVLSASADHDRDACSLCTPPTEDDDGGLFA